MRTTLLRTDCGPKWLWPSTAMPTTTPAYRPLLWSYSSLASGLSAPNPLSSVAAVFGNAPEREKTLAVRGGVRLVKGGDPHPHAVPLLWMSQRPDGPSLTVHSRKT